MAKPRLSLDRAFDHGLAGQRQGSASDVAVYHAFDVNVAGADKVSGDRQIGWNDRVLGRRGRWP